LKKQGIKTLVLLGLLLSVSAIIVNAQGRLLIRKVEIPFDFSVGDKKFPAGAYNITSVNSEKTILRLSSADGQEVVNILTNPVRAKETPNTSKLIFRRYGETYFLYQIWESYNDQGRYLSKSRTERSVERDLSKGGERPSIVDLVATP